MELKTALNKNNLVKIFRKTIQHKITYSFSAIVYIIVEALLLKQVVTLCSFKFLAAVTVINKTEITRS